MKATNSAALMPRLAALFLAALVLCGIAIWNKQPFFYSDTTTYLRGAEMGLAKVAGPGLLTPWSPAASSPDRSGSALPVSPDTRPDASDRPSNASAPANNQPAMQTMPLTSMDDQIVLAGRSVYYGVLLYAGYLTGGMWLAVVVQALCVSYVLQLLMVRLWGLRTRDFVAAAAALTVLTPLGAFTGFLMPDIFAPLVILSIGTLAVYWSALARTDRWLLSALLLFGLSAHASHMAMAALLLALLVLARLIAARWRGIATPALLVVVVCLGGAVAAELAFNQAVTKAVGSPPLRLPHPMARLIDLGPGTAFLQQRCADASKEPYTACKYLQNYPTPWEDFLFSTDPAKGAFALSDSATKRRLSNEQLGFVADVVRFDPLGTLSGVAANVVHQIFNFRVDVWSYGANNVQKNYAGRVPDSVYAKLQQSRAASPQPWHIWLTLATYTAVSASLAWAAYLWLRRGRGDSSDAVDAQGYSQTKRFTDFVWIVCTGVVANAVVCATLASSMDRFQARVIWLLPFLALCAFALHARRTARQVDARRPASVYAHHPIPCHSSSNPSLQGTTP